MRHTKTTLGLAIAAAFATGIVVSPLVHRAIPDAHAAAAPLTPAVIDLRRSSTPTFRQPPFPTCIPKHWS